MDIAHLIQAVVGFALAGIGVWATIIGRKRLSRVEGASPGAWSWLGVGLALAGVGYHLAAWGLPPNWLVLRVPAERWWIVIAVAVVVAAGSLGLERSERNAS